MIAAVAHQTYGGFRAQLPSIGILLFMLTLVLVSPKIGRTRSRARRGDPNLQAVAGARSSGRRTASAVTSGSARVRRPDHSSSPRRARLLAPTPSALSRATSGEKTGWRPPAEGSRHAR